MTSLFPAPEQSVHGSQESITPSYPPLSSNPIATAVDKIMSGPIVTQPATAKEFDAYVNEAERRFNGQSSVVRNETPPFYMPLSPIDHRGFVERQPNYDDPDFRIDIHTLHQSVMAQLRQYGMLDDDGHSDSSTQG